MVVSYHWWPIWDVGGRIIMLATFFVMLVIFTIYQIGHQHPESVTDILNWSPTHLVSSVRHQHQCNHDADIISVQIWHLLNEDFVLITFCEQSGEKKRPSNSYLIQNALMKQIQN